MVRNQTEISQQTDWVEGKRERGNVKEVPATKKDHSIDEEPKTRVTGKQKVVLQNKAEVRTVSWSLHLPQ